MASKLRYVLRSLLGDNTVEKGVGGAKVEDNEAILRPAKELKRISAVKEKKVKQLSSLANTVVLYSARVLRTTPGHLQVQFENTTPSHVKQPLHYARCFVEFCCFRALEVLIRRENFINDKGFWRFTFDLMIAWESPNAESQPVVEDEGSECVEEDEDVSLFYSDLMPILATAENAVGLEAFVEIAPLILLVADTITAHFQFEALTAFTDCRLPYALYDRYIGALARCAKDMKNKSSLPYLSALPMVDGEHMIEVDGLSASVILHIGSSPASGRLTLTDHSLYFEESGIVSYHKASRFDLSAALDHDLVPDLIGPWGSHIFDNAIRYKTSSLSEPIIVEFPEISGSKRRDYWIAITREIVCVHKFIRKFQLEGLARSEALGRAMLGIIKLQATKSCFQLLPSDPGTLLTFSSAENLPAGDSILESIAATLKSAKSDLSSSGRSSVVDENDGCNFLSSSSLWILYDMGLLSPEESWKAKTIVISGESTIGDLSSLQKAVQQSRQKLKEVEKAKATVEEVKSDGIGTNVAMLNELLLPITVLIWWIWDLISWREVFKTGLFFFLFLYVIYRDWLGCVLPALPIIACGWIIWLRISGRAKKYREVLVLTPKSGITIEQMATAQRTLSQIEGILQKINVVLLKFHALIWSPSPWGMDFVLLALFGLALTLAILPFKYVALAIHVSIFTSQLKKKTTDGKGGRRLREWWDSIPVPHVRFVESQEKKTIEESFQN